MRGPDCRIGRSIRPELENTPVSHADDHVGTRRDFLYYATAGAGTVAAGAAARDDDGFAFQAAHVAPLRCGARAVVVRPPWQVFISTV